MISYKWPKSPSFGCTKVSYFLLLLLVYVWFLNPFLSALCHGCINLVFPRNTDFGISLGLQEARGMLFLLWILSQHLVVMTGALHLCRDPVCGWGWREIVFKPWCLPVWPQMRGLYVSVYRGWEVESKTVVLSISSSFQIERCLRGRWVWCYQWKLVCPLISTCSSDGVSWSWQWPLFFIAASILSPKDPTKIFWITDYIYCIICLLIISHPRRVCEGWLTSEILPQPDFYTVLIEYTKLHICD